MFSVEDMQLTSVHVCNEETAIGVGEIKLLYHSCLDRISLIHLLHILVVEVFAW